MELAARIRKNTRWNGPYGPLLHAVTPAAMLRRTAGTVLRLFLWGHAALIGIVAVASLLLLFLNPPTTSLRLYRFFTRGWRAQPTTFVPLRQIPSVTRRMVVGVEDYTFYSHPGVDLAAIVQAYNVNKLIGYNLYGGSTITQQLARTLFFNTRKTYLRKYVEAIAALELDLILGKDRILELYFNSIEWGKGVYGIGAAARYHFHKKVASLSLEETARLISILTNPILYDVNTYWKSRQMAERYRFLIGRYGS